MIYQSRLPTVDIPDSAVTPFVLQRSDELSGLMALIDGPSGRSYTYQQLASATAKVAGGLAARGFGPGQVLAILLPNLPEYFLAFHGAAMAGGTVTTVNPTYGLEEIHFQLIDSAARFLVTIPMFLETSKKAIEGTSVEEIYVLGEAEGATPFISLAAADPIGQVHVDPKNDAALLPYSSGTTGLPKGVMLTHHNLVANMCQVLHVLELEAANERVLAVLPFFHIYWI